MAKAKSIKASQAKTDKNRRDQAIRGLSAIYESLTVKQLQLYHGVDEKVARRIKKKEIQKPPKGSTYRDRWSFGGLGSGKTFGASFAVLAMSIFYENNEGIVLRKRKEQLRNTIGKDFTDLVKLATDDHVNALISDPREEEGAIIIDVFTPGEPSKMIFRIEPDGDSRFISDSLKGYQLGWFLLEEMSQLRKVTYDTLRGRLRRPNVLTASMGLSNPVYTNHWMAEEAAKYETQLLHEERPPILVIRSKTADNPHLRPDYLEGLKAQYADDPIGYSMMIEGQDGVNVEGTPVFGRAFKTDMHVRRDILPNPYLPMIRGWDFGWHHPACVFMQITDRGYVNVFAEVLGDQETAHEFGQRILGISTRLFPNIQKWEDYGDPAGAQRTDKGDTTLAILGKLGIRIGFRPSLIDTGLDLIRNLLGSLREGRPRLVFHPRCRDMIKGMIGGYYYKESRSGAVKPKPYKDGYYDHLMDAFRYAIINTCEGPGSTYDGGAMEALGMEPVDVASGDAEWL